MMISTKIKVCVRIIPAKFFKGNEFTEMVNMLKTKTETKYENTDFREVFEARYNDGRADGILQVAENLLRTGSDEEYVSINTGIPLDEIKNIKRRL